MGENVIGWKLVSVKMALGAIGSKTNLVKVGLGKKGFGWDYGLFKMGLYETGLGQKCDEKIIVEWKWLKYLNAQPAPANWQATRVPSHLQDDYDVLLFLFLFVFLLYFSFYLYFRWSSKIPLWLVSLHESELGQVTGSLSSSLFSTRLLRMKNWKNLKVKKILSKCPPRRAGDLVERLATNRAGGIHTQVGRDTSLEWKLAYWTVNSEQWTMTK